MTDFINNINERLSRLKQTKELSKKKSQYDKIFSTFLVDSDWNDIIQVNDFEAAFLDLLNEIRLDVLKQIHAPLVNRFYEMYKNSDDDNERRYSPKNELTLHRIQVPSEQSDEWQITYEMTSDDTIFHAEFEGWTFKHTGVTH